MCDMQLDLSVMMLDGCLRESLSEFQRERERERERERDGEKEGDDDDDDDDIFSMISWNCDVVE